jgi:Predicted molecular chaperone distantly related to HSP70-fold metalloproteases
MRVLGMISGTSHDGIDVATVEFDQADGELTGRIVHADSRPYRPQLRSDLIAMLPPAQTSLAQVCELDTAIGQAFAEAAATAIADGGPVDAICSHGQTVFHWVADGRALGTLQIGQPAWIAERTGVPVVADIRARDLAVGGQGAPLASFIDYLLLKGRPGISGALNLGGISNLTVVAPHGLSAWDIGPSNALADAVVVERGLNPLGYDDDATIASAGTVDAALLAELLAEPYYRQQPPKSTGKELFNLEYVQRALAASGRNPSDADLLATLIELTARTVADTVRASGVGYLAASGGGCRNPLLMRRLRELLPGVQVALTDELGLPADTKEAVLMALIGWCTLHGVPGIAPGGTGSTQPRILGSITPGTGPLVLPEPVVRLDSLRMLSSGEPR